MYFMLSRRAGCFFLKGGVDMLSKDCLFLVEIAMHDIWLSHHVSNISFNRFKLQVKDSLKNLFT